MSTRAAILCVLAVVAVTLAGTAVMWLKGSPGERPTLALSPGEVQLGTLLVGETRSFQVLLRNMSGEPAEIERIKPSCSCGNVVVSSTHLAPGDESALTGTFRGMSGAGPFEQGILVALSNPRRQHFVIPVVGTVKRRIELSPAKVTLRPDFAAQKPGIEQCLLHNGGAETIEVREDAQLPAGLRLRLEPRTVPAGGECTIAVEADPSQISPSDSNLTLRCSHPIEKRIDLAVEVRPIGGVTVTPPRVDLGVLAKAHLLAARDLNVSFDGELLRDCDVEEVKTPPYLVISAATQTSATSRRYLFAIRPQGVTGADLGGRIVLCLRHRPSARTLAAESLVFGFVSDAVPN